MTKEKFPYSKRQLETILSAHAAGQLCRGGGYWMPAGEPLGFRGCGCINQIAFNDPQAMHAFRMHGPAAARIAERFDSSYDENMTPEDLLALVDRGYQEYLDYLPRRLP